jgi:hypothetical protein
MKFDLNSLRAEVVTKLDAIETDCAKLEAICVDSPGATKAMLMDLTALRQRVNSDLKLVVTIAGQVNAGKSSLVNALFFEGKEIAPTAPTPFTAALTVITFGSSESAEVEFITKNDLKQLEENAEKYQTLSEEEKLNPEVTNLKSANEIVRKIEKLKLSTHDFLGRTEKMSIAEAREFAGGDRAAIIRTIRIFIPNKLLEGVWIVDTPGLNDAVSSRSKVTLDFLDQSDVVFYLSPANQFMQDFDIAEIKKYDALGKKDRVEFVMAKFDEILTSGEVPEDLHAEILQGARKRMAWPEFEAMPVIQMMAAIASLLRQEIQLTKKQKFYLENYTKDICPQERFLEYSGIKNVTETIEAICKDKERIIRKNMEAEITRFEGIFRRKIEQAKDRYEKKIKFAKDNIDGAIALQKTFENDLGKITKSLRALGKKWCLSLERYTSEYDRGCENFLDDYKNEIDVNRKFRWNASEFKETNLKLRKDARKISRKLIDVTSVLGTATEMEEEIHSTIEKTEGVVGSELFFMNEAQRVFQRSYRIFAYDFVNVNISTPAERKRDEIDETLESMHVLVSSCSLWLNKTEENDYQKNLEKIYRDLKFNRELRSGYESAEEETIAFIKKEISAMIENEIMGHGDIKVDDLAEKVQKLGDMLAKAGAHQ